MKTIQKAYKFRLYPNQDQQILIAKTLGSCRYVFNHFLNEWNITYKTTSKGLSYSKCSKELPSLKSELTWLREIDSTALQTTLKHLDTSFKNFFRKQNQYPKFKSKKNPVQSYTSKFTNNNIRIEGKRMKLPKLGYVRFKPSRELGGRIISATVKKSATGKYYVSLLVEESKPTAFKKTHASIGIDYGLKDLMVLSDGETVPNIKSYRALENKLKKAQRSLSRKHKGSSNYYKDKLKIAKIHEKIANVREFHLHKVTTALVKNHDFIAIEDLCVKDMLQDSNLSKSISDVSLAKCTEMLTYKANWYGKTLVKVDKYFPSSQLCSSCGHQNPELKDYHIRKWDCPICHVHHDRDFNASVNILKEGLRIALQRTVGATGVA